MKQLILLLFFLITLVAEAQVIRYDTIRVAAGDERNIHRATKIYSSAEEEHINVDEKQSSQSDLIRFNRRKLRFGADMGLSLSRNYTRLGIGPQVGYQLNPYLMAGAGIKYYYTRADLTSYESRDNLLGANIFGYFYPARFIALFAQPELNYIRSSLTDKSTGNENIKKGMVPSLVVGGGLRLGRSHITLNYDLIQHLNSPHPAGFYLGVSAFF
jgi:outer membrane protein assembly factor BamA